VAQSRREQLQAYRFMQRRVRTALLDADPDTNDAPLARMGTATYAGIMVAILVLAGAGIYGIFNRGGSTAWKKPGTLITERETSRQFIYVDKTLYQVQNVTSAQLILGPTMTILDVAHNSLRNTRHGGIVGIRGAPEDTPKPKDVAGSTWSVCVGGNLTATSAVPMQIQPGVKAAGATIPATSGILLRAPQGTFLLAQSHVYLIPAKWLTALSYGSATPGVPVANAFVAAIPRGQTLQPITGLVGFRGQGPKLGVGGQPTKIGQVLEDATDRRLYYLVVSGGLAPLTALQARLQLADPATQRLQGGVRARVVDPDVLTGVPIKKLPKAAPRAQQAPINRPAPLTPTPNEQVCVVYPPTSAAPTVVHGSYVPVPNTAGLVRLPLGAGAVVQVPSAVAAPATYFVSDAGVAFPIDNDGLSQLGLEQVAKARVPSSVLGAIVAGPPLDKRSASALAAGGFIKLAK
jgi:ESX secretion system ATPase EccB